YFSPFCITSFLRKKYFQILLAIGKSSLVRYPKSLFIFLVGGGSKNGQTLFSVFVASTNHCL
ncbi:MAG: hypothetical protein E6Z68_16365, partial [Enterococcus casseliflavus]|nr:hypothetical protein [Enterococcus casseliflavus]